MSIIKLNYSYLIAIKKGLIFSIIYTLSLLCLGQTNAKKPVQSFEKLWKTFDVHYANFDMKGVDWTATYETFRPQVTEHMSEKEVFEKLCGMSQMLNDGHVYLWAEVDGKEKVCGPPYDFFYEREFAEKGQLKEYGQLIQNTLLDAGFDSLSALDYTRNTKIRYATSDQYGYLRISGMAEGIIMGRLNRSMKTVMEAIQDKEGLIIDLRLNGGGWDVTSYKFAGRFINDKTIGHYKETRKKGTDEFKKLKTWTLKPKGPIQFTKPIIILTSDYTASAAEIFLLAMHQFPYVKIIGQPSEGIFSDMYMFRLPNGWKASLSNQRYYDINMKNYEGLGLPVEVYVENKTEQLGTRQDPYITEAISLLGDTRNWD